MATPAVVGTQGHQEITRLVEEIEAFFTTLTEQEKPALPSMEEASDEDDEEDEALVAQFKSQQNLVKERGVAIESLSMWLQQMLGYEDEPELDEAVGMPFIDFLRGQPQLEVREDGVDEDGKPRLCVRRRNPDEMGVAGKPRSLFVEITSSSDLLDFSCVKSKEGSIEIPHLDFAIPAGEATNDKLYNFIAQAILHLSTQLSVMRRSGAVPVQTTEATAAAVAELEGLLDVDTPFWWVVRDPLGDCQLEPKAQVLEAGLSDPAPGME